MAADDDCKKTVGLGCCGLFILGILITVIVIVSNIWTLGPEDQVLIIYKLDREVINGPQTLFISPSWNKELRKAVRLGPREYAVVRHARQQIIRHVDGPRLYFLDPWDELKDRLPMVVLQKNEYIRMVDKSSGFERVIGGPTTIVPKPLEYSPNGTEQAEIIAPDTAVVVLNKTRGNRFLVDDLGAYIPEPYLEVVEKRKAIVVGPQHYASVKNTRTGAKQNVAGSAKIKLGPYEVLDAVKLKIVLKFDEYVRLVDQKTGAERVVAGSGTLVPEPTEFYSQIEKSVRVLDTTTVRILNKTSGMKWTACRCDPAPDRKNNVGGVFSPGPYEVITDVLTATLLGPDEYAVLENERQGVLRHVEGPKLVHLGAYDVLKAVRKKILLQRDEFVRLVDEKTGEERVIGGPARVVPSATETFPPKNGVEKAVFLDGATSVLMLNKTTGLQEVIRRVDNKAASPGVFVPARFEEVVKERDVVRVLPYEAVIVRGQDGTMTIYQDSSGKSFFIPAYAEIVTQYWSSYGDPGVKPGTKKPVNRIDLREKKMYYEYEVRTNDNVKLKLEGSLFWRVQDVSKMVAATMDAEGDVWQKSRSTLIQAVSSVTFSEFMNGLSNVTDAAYKSLQPPQDNFLSVRGLLLTSMEVTGFTCMDAKTARILQEIIEETINRINRLEKQKSDNEVAKVKMQGDIQVEQQRSLLLQQRALNQKLVAETEGKAAGFRQVSGAATFIQGLNTSVDNVSQRVEIFKTREKVRARNADTKIVAAQAATLFMEPQAANLDLENEL